IPLFAADAAFHRLRYLVDQRRIASDRQVDVLGEALNDAIGLGERSSAFEGDMVFEFGGGRQPAQRPADPEVLLDHDRREVTATRRLLDESAAVRCGAACEL